MKFRKLLLVVGIVLLIPMALNACSIKTIGLNKNNFKGHEVEVKGMQLLLAQDFDLYHPGWVTGYFGDLTELAIKKLQERYGLSQTGVLDEKTIYILCYQESKGLCPIRNYGYTIGDEDKVNNDIRIIQQLLSKIKKYHTGYYGKISAQIMSAFQKKAGISITGVFDKDSRDFMCKALTGVDPNKPETLDLDLVELRSSLGNKVNVGEKTSIIIKEKNNSTVEIPAHMLALNLGTKSTTGTLDKLGVSQEREQELFSYVCDKPGDRVFEVMVDSTDIIKEIDEVNNLKQLVVNCVGDDRYGYECLIKKNYQCVYGEGGRIKELEDCTNSCKKSTADEKPDLLISKVERDGDKIKVFEENKGIVADEHYLEVKLEYGNKTIDYGKPIELSSLIKGERDFSFDFECPADGVFKFRFNIDSTNVIEESNEDNNIFETEIICGDVVDPKNIMYSCDKSDGRCYVSASNTVGDYLTPEDCLNKCSSGSGDVAGPNVGYCCNVDSGQCTYCKDGKERHTKGESCWADGKEC